MTGTVDESAFIQDDASGLFVPSQSRRNIIPWDDMQAVNPADRWSQISPDLLSTLAIGVNQGSDKANLAIGNSRGAQYNASALNFTTQVSGDSNAGTNTVTVIDGNFAKMAMAIWIFPSPTNPHGIHGPYFVFPTANPHVFTLNQQLVVDVRIGDLVAAVPLTAFVSVGNHVQLDGIHILDAPGTPSTFDQIAMLTSTVYGHMRLAVDDVRSCDVTACVELVSPGVASVAIGPFGAGFRSVISWVEFSVLNNSGAVISPRARIWDGAAGTGTLKFSSTLLMPAAQSHETIFRDNLRIKGSDNTVITVTYDTGGANVFESISVGAYVEG